jgi:hypothetical protein
MTYFRVNHFSISNDISLEYFNLWLNSVPRSRLYIRNLKFTQYFQAINKFDVKMAIRGPNQLMRSCPNLSAISLGMPARCLKFEGRPGAKFRKFVKVFRLRKILALPHLKRICLICYVVNDSGTWLRSMSLLMEAILQHDMNALAGYLKSAMRDSEDRELEVATKIKCSSDYAWFTE